MTRPAPTAGELDRERAAPPAAAIITTVSPVTRAGGPVEMPGREALEHQRERDPVRRRLPGMGKTAAAARARTRRSRRCEEGRPGRPPRRARPPPRARGQRELERAR